MNKISRLSVCLAVSLFFGTFGVFAQETDGLGPSLGRIVTRNAIHLGYREAALPFSYVPAGQTTPVGYGWEVCGRVAQAIEARLGKPLKVVPIPVTDNARVMMLKTGVVDLDCGTVGNTFARQKLVGLSLTLYVSEHRVLVRRGAGIARFEQLAGKRVVVQGGSLAERYVRQAALARNIEIELLSAATPAEAVAQLARGEAAAYVGEDAVLAAAQDGGDEFLANSLAAEPLALMMPKDDAVLKKLVDETLVGLMRSGELERIYDRWFMQPIPAMAGPATVRLNLPLSPQLKAAIQAPNDRPVN